MPNTLVFPEEKTCDMLHFKISLVTIFLPLRNQLTHLFMGR